MKYFTKMFLILFVLGHMMSTCVNAHSRTSQEFDVTQCVISRDPVYGGKLIDCSGLGIRKLPLNEIPDNTTTLILDHNNFRRLHNHSFYVTSLSSLRHLSIQFSKVAKIEVDALFGLDSLEILDLENNQLRFCRETTTSFPAGMFKHVPNLRHLFIGYNTHDFESSSECQTYPEHIDIFSSLPQLTNLSIDTVNTTLYLGHEFSNLTHLTNLTVVCSQVLYITNSSLEGLRQLQVKVLSLVAFKTEVRKFEHGVFQKLPHLVSLSVDGGHFGNHNILKALKPFANRRMIALNLKTTNYLRSFSVPKYIFHDGIIGRNLFRFVTSICVTHFSWTNSILFAFKPKSLTSGVFLECVKTIDLSHNKLENFGWLMDVMEFRKFKYLSEITLSSYNAPPSDQYPKLIHFNFPGNTRNILSPSYMNNKSANKDVDSSYVKILPRSSSQSYLSENSTFIQVTNNSMQNVGTKKDKRHTRQNRHSYISTDQSDDTRTSGFPYNGSGFPYNGNITCYLMPSLRSVKVINIIFAPVTIGSWTIVVKSNDNFEELYWIDNINLLAKGVIYGVENLKLLDLTGSMFDITDHFFDTFLGLEVFVLSGLKPDSFFKQISVQRLLRNLTNLRYLDVSNNKLNSFLFTPTTFSSTPNITHVILSQNRFSHIPFDLTTTPKLQVLDLSANAILFLTDDEMETLNSHVTSVGNFLLRLQDNGIACVCSQINFLVWSFTTQVTIDQRGTSDCLTEDGQKVNVSDLSDIHTFSRACNSRYFLMVAVILASLLAVMFLLTCLVTRWRTSIEAFLLRLFVRAFRSMRPEDYRTSVFIGYTDDDYEFVRHVLRKYLEETLGVSTFIHQRDLRAGYTDQQFFKAIRDSWRVLLVLSRKFLNDYDMAEIVMKYASHSVTAVNQHRVFVLVEESQVHAIPDYLHGVLDENRIIILHDLHHQLDYEQKQSIKHCLRAAQ